MEKLKKIICEDGSETFLNMELGEHYHSTSGASSEARQKHAHPARLARRSKANGGTIRILDFAFGLGYNSAAALEVLLEKNTLPADIEITALEIDRAIILRIPEMKSDIRHYEIIRDFAEAFRSYSQLIKPFVYKRKDITIRLYLEDALERIKLLKNNHYDAVFFDPFSSTRVPGLWKQEVFDTLFKKLKNGGVLTTYSCARHFRNKLGKAGFIWRDVPPGFERRGPSTVAFKRFDPFSGQR